jgi:hypothetical protein
MVEAGAELAPSIGAGARVVGKPEAAAAGVDLAVARGAEALRLHRRVGRHSHDRDAKSVAGLDATAKALRLRARVSEVAYEFKPP